MSLPLWSPARLVDLHLQWMSLGSAPTGAGWHRRPCGAAGLSAQDTCWTQRLGSWFIECFPPALASLCNYRTKWEGRSRVLPLNSSCVGVEAAPGQGSFWSLGFFLLPSCSCRVFALRPHLTFTCGGHHMPLSQGHENWMRITLWTHCALTDHRRHWKQSHNLALKKIKEEKKIWHCQSTTRKTEEL